MKKFKTILLVLVSVMSLCLTTSCKDDDEKQLKDLPIIGTWESIETWSDSYEVGSLKMTLTFNKDKTGSIVEVWSYQTRSSETYSMNFSWSTTTDASGNDILKVSYVSGDKNTEIFLGGDNTVLWTRQFVLTGKILNIYGGDGVWVFNKK